jgi:arylsulfatase
LPVAARIAECCAWPPADHQMDALGLATWVIITIGDAIKDLMKTFVKYPPRKLQSASYSGPVTLTNYERFQWVREQLAKEGINLALPTGN